ncbi:Ribosomal-protein-L7p-serine acetyltransferase [Minicystis rosea]|nr:Ribosomal-protein-L7p-serine acetyltransferase [Minicystis rosea]
MRLPERLDTDRLILRRWQPADAPLFKSAVDASLEHLRPWLPWARAEPTPLAGVETRLGAFAALFDEGREWLYGIFPHGEGEVLGGIGVHPRNVVDGRPEYLEIGYWLRVDATGHGFMTEAVGAAVTVVLASEGIARIEIRCDPRNAQSAAVPRRLGFHLARTQEKDALDSQGQPRDTMVWERLIAPSGA